VEHLADSKVGNSYPLPLLSRLKLVNGPYGKCEAKPFLAEDDPRQTRAKQSRPGQFLIYRRPEAIWSRSKRLNRLARSFFLWIGNQ